MASNHNTRSRRSLVPPHPANRGRSRSPRHSTSPGPRRSQCPRRPSQRFDSPPSTTDSTSRYARGRSRSRSASLVPPHSANCGRSRSPQHSTSPDPRRSQRSRRVIQRFDSPPLTTDSTSRYARARSRSPSRSPETPDRRRSSRPRRLPSRFRNDGYQPDTKQNPSYQLIANPPTHTSPRRIALRSRSYSPPPVTPSRSRSKQRPRLSTRSSSTSSPRRPPSTSTCPSRDTTRMSVRFNSMLDGDDSTPAADPNGSIDARGRTSLIISETPVLRRSSRSIRRPPRFLSPRRSTNSSPELPTPDPNHLIPSSSPSTTPSTTSRRSRSSDGSHHRTRSTSVTSQRIRSASTPRSINDSARNPTQASVRRLQSYLVNRAVPCRLAIVTIDSSRPSIHATGSFQ